MLSLRKHPNKQTYRSGRNEIDSKSIWQQCHVGSNPTVCAKSSTLRGAALYFCRKLCKGCKVGFEQPVPGALRPAGKKCPGGAFSGRGRIRASAPKAAPCGVLLFIFAANFARAARWDSNSPCPALCVPPGKNAPVGHFQGAGEFARLRHIRCRIERFCGRYFWFSVPKHGVSSLYNDQR